MLRILKRAFDIYSEQGLREVGSRGFHKLIHEVPYTAPRIVRSRVKYSRYPAQGRFLRQLQADDDWLLVVLDACRYDVFEDLFEAYFEGELEPVTSEGRDTFEYVSGCWPDYYDLPYVSGVPPVNSHLTSDFDQERWSRDLYGGYVPREHFETILDVWNYEWEADTRATPPGIVTDAALDVEDQKKVVHYQQPHAPYVGEYSPDGQDEKTLPQLAGTGLYSDAELMKMYRSNLELALGSVAQLVNQSTADRVIITGDHGEALGEYEVYGHPRESHPYNRTVPWAEISGVRKEAISQSDRSYSERAGGRDIESRLEDLGYL